MNGRARGTAVDAYSYLDCAVLFCLEMLAVFHFSQRNRGPRPSRTFLKMPLTKDQLTHERFHENGWKCVKKKPHKWTTCTSQDGLIPAIYWRSKSFCSTLFQNEGCHLDFAELSEKHKSKLVESRNSLRGVWFRNHISPWFWYISVQIISQFGIWIHA